MRRFFLLVLLLQIIPVQVAAQNLFINNDNLGGLQLQILVKKPAESDCGSTQRNRCFETTVGGSTSKRKQSVFRGG